MPVKLFGHAYFVDDNFSTGGSGNYSEHRQVFTFIGDTPHVEGGRVNLTFTTTPDIESVECVFPREENSAAVDCEYFQSQKL